MSFAFYLLHLKNDLLVNPDIQLRRIVFIESWDSNFEPLFSKMIFST